MFRQSVFGRLAGYEDVNDALRLRHDPAMRWIIGGKAAKGLGASPSQMGRFETDWLARPENLATLTDLSGHWIDQVAKRRSSKRVVLDMDSSVSPTHGEHKGNIILDVPSQWKSRRAALGQRRLFLLRCLFAQFIRGIWD